MQLPTILVMVIASALVICTLLRKWPSLAGRAARPPGPRGLPLLGHLHMLGRLPYQTFYELSKVYGPLMSMRLGAVPIIVASTPDMAQQILHTHDLAFAGRPRTAASFYLSRNGSDIAFAQPDRYWRFKRQLCASQLFSNKRLQSLKWMREEEVGALLRSFTEGATEHSDSVSVRPKLMEASNNIICRMIFGKRLSEGSKEKNLVSDFTEAMALLGTFNVGDYVPCLAWMDLQGCTKRSKAVALKIQSAVQAIIDERRRHETAASGDEIDLLQVLLNASSSQGDQMTDDHIVGVLEDMFSAGTETIAYTIEWALAELLCNPKKLNIVQREIDGVVGRGRRIQENDIVQLPYLQAVVKEVMRLHPVAPLLIPHVANQPCTIANFDIPMGTQAYVNAWAIGRDQRWWEKPLDFMPERFLQDSSGSMLDVIGLQFRLIPFGSGRRSCIGRSLGLISVQIMLASLIHGFDWSTPTKLINMSERFDLMMRMESPLTTLVTPRLPTYCYA